ncbi:hypothetical protein [Microvirga sp. VF16]|uniref:hypothetical protein n=1 Tax=Microvirga sp. VF16 TaxID=2807101 RepID=UPI00193E3169|nr:hypothetical protein [Microvirga sp. VF16]QRM34980.1 hypothetical protein JO965_42735 [Microvirga sp. VF16]
MSPDPDYVIQARYVPTLLGLKKTPSPWELWHVLKGNIPSAQVESSRGFWSRRLHREFVIGLQERYSCILFDRSKEQIHPTRQILSRHLVEVRSRGQLPLSHDTKHIHLIQISSENYAINWNVNGVVQAPPYIVAEVHPIMAALGIESLAIALIVAGGEFEAFVEIDFDPPLWEMIKTATTDFIFSLDMDEEPAPDFAIDGDAIEKRYRPMNSDPADYSEDRAFNKLVTEYEAITQEIQGLERDVREKDKAKRKLKAQLITALGNRSAAQGKGFRLLRDEHHVGEQKRAAYSYSTLKIDRQTQAV